MSLLDSGATARVTEIAAKSLANLGSAPNNRTGIRLAGGIPPLVALLMEQPTPQVIIAFDQDMARPDVAIVTHLWNTYVHTPNIRRSR